ncbi:MAG: Bug family tripartite tricarboxylate transporter substrate binding protein, partial [Chloroflexota bacterium]
TPAPAKPTEAAKPAASPSASPAAAASPGAVPAASPAASPAAAVQPVPRVDPSLASVWQGKTITLIVAENPGGGNDAWARLVARHIGKHLPGTPNVIVENMPGAGHRIGANAIYAARPDGLTMGLVDRYIPSFQLRGEGAEEGVRYDATKIGWLGSTTTETQVVFISSRTGVKEAKDLQDIQINFTNATPGSPPHVNQVVLKEALGWKTRSIFGYVGTAQQWLALDRDEVDGLITAWSSAVLQKGDDIRSGKYLPIAQIGGARLKDPLAARAPWSEDLFQDKSPEMKQLLALAQRPFAWSRSFLTTPNLPPNVLATMRAAFLLACADPAFLAEAEQLKFDVDPVSGERVQELILDYMNTPKLVVERLSALIEADTPS